MKKQKFIAYVETIKACIEKGVFQTDPKYPKNVLIYKTDLSPEEYGAKEGWVSEAVTDVAQELTDSEKARETFMNSLKLVGVLPQYENGDFIRLDFDEKSPYEKAHVEAKPLKKMSEIDR